MILSIKISAQSSFGLSGYRSPLEKGNSLINGFESNLPGFSMIKDWGFTLEYGETFSQKTASNIYLIAITKRLGNNIISARYTPGYSKEFDFLSSESILLQDSSAQSIVSKFIYNELFGVGYSYIFLPGLSVGFTLRYFSQQFAHESIVPVYSDSLYLKRDSQVENANFWKADFGLNYFPFKNLALSLSSVNFLDINERTASGQNQTYQLRRKKGILAGLSYAPFNNIQLNLLYESNNDFLTGINSSFPFLSGKVALGISVFHDEYQSPFIAGIIPALSFSTDLFGITLSGVKYFSDRNVSYSITEFEQNGIRNIINNRYSFNKIILTLSLALNTSYRRKVEFLKVNILNDIYPTLSDFYINKPFAEAKVVNLTNKYISIKPSSRIEEINNERIYSPTVTASPHDTVEISFYTIVPNGYFNNKANISYVDFYLNTTPGNTDDKFQKPVLIYGINAWDGNVSNLRYFIKKNYSFSMGYAKNILSHYKTKLDSLPYELSNFYKSKIIFNTIVKKMVYFSDPRASADYVQFPHETLKLKGGDCDDLSVLYSSLLESIGIETALVDYKPTGNIGHVNVLINTNLSPEQAILITKNDTKYFIRKNTKGIDKVWIPIETTSLTDFNTAWNLGTEKFNNDAINNLGLIKGTVNIVNIK